MDGERPEDLGWWVICGAAFLGFLRRAHAGENPDMLMAEIWANSEHGKFEE